MKAPWVTFLRYGTSLFLLMFATTPTYATVNAPTHICVDTMCATEPTPPTSNTSGPLSKYTWWTGHWVNGDDDQNVNFESWRNMPADAVTQSISGLNNYYYEMAGCLTEADCLTEFRQTPANFKPTFNGIFTGTGWKRHIWGGYPATEHRKRLIHLGWMDAIPKSVGNQNGANPRLWYDIKNGQADRYMFLLGRKFAYLDKQYGDPTYPMTFDYTYEWTITSHPQWPSGTYTINGEVRETFRDFPYGWNRMVRVFKEGYRYQRGLKCPYRFSWRPQLAFSVRDKNKQVVRHEAMWPNDFATWEIAQNVTIDGVVVLPQGPIGRHADFVAVSWHDSSKVMVQGKTLATGNWQAILNGYSSHWGLQEVANFARQKGVKMVFPEWAARRDTHPPASLYPGDVYRMTHWFFNQNKDVLAYENVFDIGSGTMTSPWIPPAPADQDPGTVYRSLWHK